MVNIEEGRQLHATAVELLTHADEGEEANDAAIGTWDWWKTWAIENCAELLEEIAALRLRVEDDPNAPGFGACQRWDCQQIVKNSNDAMGENTALRHQLAHAVHDYESRTRPCAKKNSPEGCEFCPPEGLHDL